MVTSFAIAFLIAATIVFVSGWLGDWTQTRARREEDAYWTAQALNCPSCGKQYPIDVAPVCWTTFSESPSAVPHFTVRHVRKSRPSTVRKRLRCLFRLKIDDVYVPTAVNVSTDGWIPDVLFATSRPTRKQPPLVWTDATKRSQIVFPSHLPMSGR